VAKARDAASVIGGKLDTAEATARDLRKQLGEAEAQMTDALDARLKVEGQLSEFCAGRAIGPAREAAGDAQGRRDARAGEVKAAADAREPAEQQLARIRGTYDDIVHERDELKGQGGGAAVRGARGRDREPAPGGLGSALQERRRELNDLKKQLSRLRWRCSRRRTRPCARGRRATVDEGLLRLWARAPSCTSRWWGRCWKA